jgi:cobalt-zinc-cadmium efflux system outer membrane protein
MRSVLLFSLVCLLNAPAAFSQTTSDGASLSYADAAREAVAHDPELAELRAMVAAGRERATQTSFLDPPMIEGQIWQWPINTINPANVDMYMVSVSQEFPGRGKRALRASTLQTDVALLEARRDAREREVAAEVRTAYAQLVSARRVLETYRSMLPLLRQSVSASQTRYESGSVSQADVLEGIVGISKLFDEQIALEGTQQLAESRLNTWLLRDPGAPVGALDDIGEPPPLAPLPQLERAALERHPDLVATRAYRARADAMQAEARGDLKPDFRVAGGYMFRMQQGDAWLATLGLTWPKAPWAHGKADSRVVEAAAEAEAAGARGAMAEAAIKRQVRESYIKATTAQRRLELLRSTILPQSRQATAIAAAAYQAAQVDFQTVLQQQRMLLENQVAYSQALSDAFESIGMLERAVGSTVTVQTDATSK